MADYYVKSGASGAADGSSWTNAYTTLKAAMEARLAGDRFFVSHQHAETGASALTITSPGTASSPQTVLCVNDGATPPTTRASTATVTTTATSAITLLGFAYAYGITFSAGTGAGNSSITFGSTTTSFGWKLSACALRLGGSSVSSRIATAAIGSSTKDAYLEFANTTVQFASSSQGINLQQGRFLWRATSSAITGATLPTTLFLGSANSVAQAEISGVDLSALGSGKNLVNVGNASTYVYKLRGCKLGASVSAVTGTIVGQGGTEVYLDDCDSGATNYRMEHYKFQGSIAQETTKVLSATDGTTLFSRKMVSLSSGPTFHQPLVSPPMSDWNDATGSSKTLTVEVLHDSTTALTNADVWVEVEYAGDSSSPLATLTSNRVADDLTTPANQTSSSASWVTTGLTNPNKQKLQVSFTPQMKGPIRAWVCLAKANYTIYYDTNVQVA